MEQNIIVGLRFHPTDHELVYKYLKEKLDGLITDCEDIIDINIYNFEPFDLPNHSRSKSVDDVLYFFCARNCKGLKTRWSKRTTEAGYWKPTGKRRPVKHKITKKEIGTKRTLVFHLGRHPKGTRTGWIMHEYEYTGKHSNGGDTANSNRGDFVLCKIKKNIESKNGKSESSTSASLMDQNEALTTFAESVVASTSNQNIDGLPMNSEMTSAPPKHLEISPDNSESNCFNPDIFFDFGNDQTEANVWHDFNQSQLICSAIPTQIDFESDVQEEWETFLELENEINSTT